MCKQSQETQRESCLFPKPEVMSCGNGFHSYWLTRETGNKNDRHKLSRLLVAPVCSGESDLWVEIWQERLHSRSSPVPEVLWVHEGSSPLKSVYCPASCFFGGRRDNALRRSIDLLYLSVIKKTRTFHYQGTLFIPN